VETSLSSVVTLAKEVANIGWEKHWGLIIAYILFELATAVGSYWIPGGSASVAYSIATDILGSVIGFYAVIKIVTKTKICSAC
jgi:hypothetical protein